MNHFRLHKSLFSYPLIEKAYYNYDLLFGETEFIFYYAESTNLTDLRNKLSFERKQTQTGYSSIIKDKY